MRSRAFVLIVGVAIGVTALASCRRIPEPANSADGDAAAIKQMLTDTKIQQRKWLESAVLRRTDGRWRAERLQRRSRALDGKTKK